MKPLTQKEIAWILCEDEQWLTPEWTGKGYTTAQEQKQRNIWFGVRKSLIQKGIVRITKKGVKYAGGYSPAKWEFTEAGQQIADLICENHRIRQELDALLDSLSTLVGRGK